MSAPHIEPMPKGAILGVASILAWFASMVIELAVQVLQ